MSKKSRQKSQKSGPSPETLVPKDLPVVPAYAWLTGISLMYLAFPSLIFILGWLKLVWAVPLATLLGIGLWKILQDLRQGHPSPASTQDIRHTALQIGISAGLALAILLISGTGGIGHRVVDCLKHDAILKGLVEKPWPVTYQVQGIPTVMAYYIGYYVPAGLMGKLFGWTVAQIALFGWTFLGLVLSMLWFATLSKTLWAPLCFLAMSGLDAVAYVLCHPGVEWNYIEIWSMDWHYMSSVADLFWVPQHALAGWIAAGIFLHSLQTTASRALPILLLGLTLIWSPFVFLGLLPFVGIRFIVDKDWRQLRLYLGFSPLAGFCLILLCGLLFASKMGDPTLPYVRMQDKLQFLPAFREGPSALIKSLSALLFFCVLEFGIFAFVIYRSQRAWVLGHKPLRWVGATLVAYLCVIPLFQYGFFNDLSARSSIPALFILWVFIVQALFQRDNAPWFRGILLSLILLGTLTPGVEIRRHIKDMIKTKTWMEVPKMEEVEDLPQLQVSYARNAFPFILQYIGSPKSFFFRTLSKPLLYSTTPAPESTSLEKR